ncbi:MAG: multidrug transporter, partial [Acidobacteria bacterium]|nr:multidrug transporter [Acidobacteriota bacterium]
MAKLLLVGTHGPDDPTRASLPYHMGKGAIEAGHEVSIALMVDAPFILK